MPYRDPFRLITSSVESEHPSYVRPIASFLFPVVSQQLYLCFFYVFIFARSHR